MKFVVVSIAMAIMIIAPMVALYTVVILNELASYLGYQSNNVVQAIILASAVWEAALVVLIARDIVSEKE